MKHISKCLNAKINLIEKLSFLFLFFIISSCKNYYISLDSFKQQFAEVHSIHKNSNTTIVGRTAFTGRQYEIVSLKKIKCTDKKGNPRELFNSPSIETRITYVPKGKSKKRRTVFYFDTIKVTDSTVSGLRSRFLGMPKYIPIDSIKKIEVQNGGKKFRYVNN